jgi:hypothetical protein
MNLNEGFFCDNCKIDLSRTTFHHSLKCNLDFCEKCFQKCTCEYDKFYLPCQKDYTKREWDLMSKKWVCLNCNLGISTFSCYTIQVTPTHNFYLCNNCANEDDDCFIRKFFVKIPSDLVLVENPNTLQIVDYTDYPKNKYVRIPTHIPVDEKLARMWYDLAFIDDIVLIPPFQEFGKIIDWVPVEKITPIRETNSKYLILNNPAGRYASVVIDDCHKIFIEFLDDYPNIIDVDGLLQKKVYVK